MSTFARTHASVPVESQLLAGLRYALGAFSKDLTAQLVALVHAQLGATKPLRQTVEKAVVESVPLLLEQAFVTSFLSGNDWTALMHATGAPKAAASADEDEELTSEAASKVLHVSRTHLNTLADSGALGVVRRTDGGHRRISRAGLLKYKALSQKRQAKGLDAMVAASQKLGLYDAELEGLPVKAGR